MSPVIADGCRPIDPVSPTNQATLQGTAEDGKQPADAGQTPAPDCTPDYSQPCRELPSRAQIERTNPTRRVQPPEGIGCYYCGKSSSVRWERDHFPLPRELGGEEMVWACQNCHDLKDRVPISEWPVEAFVQAFAEMEQTGGMGRLMLATVLKAAMLAGFEPRGLREHSRGRKASDLAAALPTEREP